MNSYIKKAHLVGIVWFDQAQNAGVYHQNWRLEGDATALAAFRKGAQYIKQRDPG